MANPYKRLLDLTAGPPLLVGTVASTTGTTSVLQLPGGGTLTVRGTAAVGATVYHRAGSIEGEAPALTGTDIEV